jgi:hypothetical protein
VDSYGSSFVCPRWFFLLVGGIPEKAKSFSEEKPSVLIGDPFGSVIFSAIAEFYVNEPFAHGLTRREEGQVEF